MENFKIGETVIALSNNTNPLQQPRIKGNSYPILDILYCPKTGKQFINIAGKIDEELLKKYSATFSCPCGLLHDNYGLHWTDSKYFCRPSELESLIREAEKEDTVEGYKKAQELLEIQQSLNLI